MSATAAAKSKAPAWSWTPQPLEPLDRGEAGRDLADFTATAAETGLPRLSAMLSQDGPVRDFLAAAFDLSDFLRDCARRRPEMLDQLFDTTIAARLAAIEAAIAEAAFVDGVSETALMAALDRGTQTSNFGNFSALTISLATSSGSSFFTPGVRIAEV